MLANHATRSGRTADPFNGQDKRGGAQINTVLLGKFGHAAVGATHRLVQLRHDLVFFPTELLDVLAPLEIADGDTACIGKDIRDYGHAFADQDVVSLDGAWSVRLHHDFT